MDRKKILWLLGIVYAVLTLAILFHHEPWEDELHAWTLARELGFFQIIYWMRYDGHFALWHFILRPFAAAGAPVFALNLIAWGLCTAGICLFIRYAKLPLWSKIFFVLSCPILYYFPVVARPYALLPLALGWLTALYPVRLKHPFGYSFAILFLLYIHSYMAGLAGMLGLFFTWDLMYHTRHMPWQLRWKKILIPPFLMVLFALGAFLMVLPAVGESSVVPRTFQEFFGKEIFREMGNVICELPLKRQITLNWGMNPALSGLFYWAALLGGLAVLWKTRRRMVWIWLGGNLWMILMAVLVYPMLMHRGYMPFLLLVFCLSQIPDRKTGKELNRKMMPLAGICISILSLMTFPDSWIMVRNDIKYPFSNQEKMAAYIEQKVPQNARIITFPADIISSTLTAYLPDHQLIHPQTNQRYRVYKRKGQIPAMLNDAVLHYYAQGSKQEFYLMFHVEMLRFYQITQQKLARGFRDFKVIPGYMTEPVSFFPAQEDYCLFKIIPLK